MLAAGFGEHLVDGLDEAGVGLRLQLAGEAQRGIRRQAHAQGADHSAFSRQFKALTGLSPSQYRETHRQPRKA